MKYLLKNRDEPILEFETAIKKIELMSTLKEIIVIDKIEKINDNIPIKLKNNLNEKTLQEWIISRRAPNNRKFIDDIIATYHNPQTDNFMSYIDVSFGLSLNDTFWIVKKDSNFLWKDYNLYENDFNKALSLIAFRGGSYKTRGFTSSPEFTTNGMLKKCWIRDGSEIYLYKGSSEPYANGGKEAYCEFYMAQVAKILKLNHVGYDLKEHHGEIVSTCKLFTDEEIGFIPIYHLLKDKSLKGYELLNEISTVYGEKEFKKLLLFDSIICNTDRHLGNFGMLVDNLSGKILKPSPVFDNGFSLLNNLTLNELSEPEIAINKMSSYFEIGFDELLKIASDIDFVDDLKSLTTFNFTRHSKYNLEEIWLKNAEEIIRSRAKLAINLALSKDIALERLKRDDNLVKTKKIKSTISKKQIKSTIVKS